MIPRTWLPVIAVAHDAPTSLEDIQYVDQMKKLKTHSDINAEPADIPTRLRIKIICAATKGGKTPNRIGAIADLVITGTSGNATSEPATEKMQAGSRKSAPIMPILNRSLRAPYSTGGSAGGGTGLRRALGGARLSSSEMWRNWY
ncbi:hypothetical protein GCM10022379_44650 [Micromonospora maritima]